LRPGECARIFTGAALPPGADAVVAQERAVVDGNAIMLDARWPRRRNVRLRGEEQQLGSVVAPAGTRVTPGLLAALINAGSTRISVARQPRVRVLTTGDEVRPAGEALKAGEIPDSNGPLIDAVLRRRGCVPLSVTHVRDDAEAVGMALDQALADADLVVTAGGASVGEHDFIVSAAAALGVQQVFWKVAQKPGKPMLFGLQERASQRALLLGLPGNPGAVLIGLVAHLGILLDRLEGLSEPGPRWQPAPLAGDVPRDPQRARLLRMQLIHDERGQTCLQPLPHQDSHMLGNLAEADVLVWIAAGESPARAGEIARWTSLPS
jgi:molybdopterin molybdotransferase